MNNRSVSVNQTSKRQCLIVFPSVRQLVFFSKDGTMLQLHTHRDILQVDPGQSAISDDAAYPFGYSRAWNPATQFASMFRGRSLVSTDSFGAFGTKPLFHRHVLQRRTQAFQMEADIKAGRTNVTTKSNKVL